MTKNLSDMNETKSILSSKFKMTDLGNINYYLGIRIDYNKEKQYLKLNQTQYIQNIIEKFRMEDAKPGLVPMKASTKLLKDDGISKPVDEKFYQSIVGSLLYLAIATRPDIAFAVNNVGKYSSSPN